MKSYRSGHVVFGVSLLEFRPPRIALFLVAIAALLHLAIPLRTGVLTSALAGSFLIAVGFFIMMAGWWLFTKDRTAICPTGTPSSLVVRGIYRVTRNPMYLGIFAMLLGLAIVVGSLPFYMAAIAYFIIMDTVFCPYEEEKLLRLFSNDFLRYEKKVRRWL